MAIALIVWTAIRRSRTHGEQSLDVGPVVGPIQQDEVHGQQHRRDVVALDRAEVHAGDPEAVTRDADVAGQALVPGREQRLECAARTDGDLPLVRLDEVVELDQVDVVDAHPLEGPFEFGPRPVTRALARLGREEDLVAMARRATGSADPRTRRIPRRCRCG